MVDKAPEQIKQESEFLRGPILSELSSEEPSFSHDAEVLLKFHGIYQQDNRDVRRIRTQQKQPLDYICMVRASIPGGILTSSQYLAMDALADKVADGTLRITTRQGLQYHFTHKSSLQQLVSTLNDNLVTTLAACGDVVRNTMSCPAPFHSHVRTALAAQTESIAKRFRPKTGAYYELWLNGEKAVSAEPVDSNPVSHQTDTDAEPLYGPTYLPRKFKIGLAYPGDNCVDIYTQDVGVVAHLEGDSVKAYTVLVGGGFGVSHADDTTYPRLASPLATVSPHQLEDVIEAVIIIQRDNGQRGDRKHARLKYLIDGWGLPKFRAAIEEHLGYKLEQPRELFWEKADDHLGWHEQGNGDWFLGVRVESGRIVDRNGVNLRSALREIVERFDTGVRFTANQDIMLTDIPSSDRLKIEALLRKANVALVEDLVPVARTAMACPALPTCGLALTEAERVLPEVIDNIHALLSELNISDEAITFRMTGCPNGCARPYSAEIGLVGRTKTSYDLMLGGSVLGNRLTSTHAKGVKRDQIVEVLRPILSEFAQNRKDSENFGDWYQRSHQV